MKITWFFIITGLLLLACGIASPLRWKMQAVPGYSWRAGSFTSVGERIYFTAANERDRSIAYQGGPQYGMMMQPRLACVACHGPDGRGGRHVMHMQVMDAPDIRYATLNSENDDHGSNNEAGMEHTQGGYDLDAFREAVVEGKHLDGEALNRDMPRWKMNDQDLAAVFEYLKSLP